VLLKIELWNVTPCGWAGGYCWLVRDKQSLRAELLPASSGGTTTIVRNVAICNPDSMALQLPLAVCINRAERLAAFLSGANSSLQIKNVAVTAATQPAACIG
jgi:hypothetical protein